MLKREESLVKNVPSEDRRKLANFLANKFGKAEREFNDATRRKYEFDNEKNV